MLADCDDEGNRTPGRRGLSRWDDGPFASHVLSKISSTSKVLMLLGWASSGC